MSPRFTYTQDTNSLSVSWVHKESNGSAAWTSSHNTGWEMTPEQWEQVLGHIAREIDRIRAASVVRQIGGLCGDLAEKIGGHGAAT
jgi:hypothetical protein